MDKKKQDATEYSRDAFLDNPIASPNDRTGYSQQAYADADEARSIADLMDATVKTEDAEIRQINVYLPSADKH